MCTTGLSHYQERYLQLDMLGTSGSSDVTKAAELMKGFAVSDMCVCVVCVCVCVVCVCVVKFMHFVLFYFCLARLQTKS